MIRVFIGWDSRFPEPAKVLAHTILKHTRGDGGVGIEFLDLDHLKRCYDFDPEPDPKASTEFTRSRFLVPWLCGYRGRAIFVDNDVIAFGGLHELMTVVDQIEDDHRFAGTNTPALYVVKHDYTPPEGTKMYGAMQTAYPRKLWSSLMVMDCTKLTCWTKRLVETAPGSRLHRFQDIPDDRIAALPPEWNEIHTLTDKTKLFHYTEGGPWYEQYKDCPYAEHWLKAQQEYRMTLSAARDTLLTSYCVVFDTEPGSERARVAVYLPCDLRHFDPYQAALAVCTTAKRAPKTWLPDTTARVINWLFRPRNQREWADSLNITANDNPWYTVTQ